MIVGLGLIALVAAGTPEALQVGTVALEMIPPTGFCAPATPEAKAGAQLTAAMDQDNMTLSTLIPCGATKMDGPDYFLVKAPNAALAATYERETFMAELEKAMALPTFADPSTTNSRVEQNIEKVIGQRPDLTGGVKPLGRDKVCVYMGGVMSLTSGDISYSRAITACMTIVGGKIITIYRYSEGARPMSRSICPRYERWRWRSGRADRQRTRCQGLDGAAVARHSRLLATLSEPSIFRVRTASARQLPCGVVSAGPTTAKPVVPSRAAHSWNSPVPSARSTASARLMVAI